MDSSSIVSFTNEATFQTTLKGDQHNVSVHALALHAMRDRCLLLQKRINALESDNMRLKLDFSKATESQSYMPLQEDEKSALLQKIAELNRQKSQLMHHVFMVSCENKNLWSKISSIKGEEKAPNKEYMKQPLLRTETYLHSTPKGSVNYQEKYSESSLEEISLKLINSYIEEKSQLVEQYEQMTQLHDEDDQFLNVASIGFNYIEDPAMDSLKEIQIQTEKLLNLKKELVQQESDLKIVISKIETFLEEELSEDEGTAPGLDDLDYYSTPTQDNVQPQLKSVVVTDASVPPVESSVHNTVDDAAPPIEKACDGDDIVPAEILSMLGEAKKVDEQFGKKIPQEISERWGKILLEGLAKEAKGELLKKMLIPENFQLAKAPKLNAEVASVLTEPAKNRDKRQEMAQNQLGSAIAGIVNLTTEIINGNLEKMQLIQKLSEISQILLDSHYHETQNRRRLIVPLLDKSFVNIAQGIKRNVHLFGDNLDENIKTKKSLEKSSQLIKKPPPQYANSRRPAGNQSQPGNSRTAPRQQTSGAARSYIPPTAPVRYYREAPQPPPQAARRHATAATTRHQGRTPQAQQSRSYDRRGRR